MSDPFSLDDIERAALSSAMQSESAMAEIVERLTPGHFTIYANRCLFTELRQRWQRREPFDLILLTQQLTSNGSLEKIGGPSYVTTVFTQVPTAANLSYYIDELTTQLQMRNVADVCRETITAIQGGDTTAGARALAALTDSVFESSPRRTLADWVREKLERMESGEPDADILKTGLSCLDKHSPLRRGDMPLIAGQRKVGKSILALSIAANVANAGVPVLYFSLEDRIPKVIDRLFAGVSRLSMNLCHVEQLTREQVKQVANGASKLAEFPLTIRDDVFDLHVLIAVARQAKLKTAIGLIVIDYAQLVRADGSDSRREEVERVSRELRLLAMELDTPILLLSQLNQQGDTRESKALEMDATAMWRLDRTDETDDRTDEIENNRRLLVIPWQRNGESGISSRIAFLGSIARVENLAPEEAEF